MLNLDTHILLHSLTGELTAKERKLLAADEWGISAIVIWEISKLSQLGRITLDLDDVDFVRLISRIHTWPISLEVCKGIRRLDFRSDPADEIIAATSLITAVPLVTRDAQIRKSKVVPLA
ncbi:MAG: PIN domain-containing protein [Planctomycetota bacterium]|nr:PIN domain-containing protein [Planctomycetota bacterium]